MKRFVIALSVLSSVAITLAQEESFTLSVSISTATHGFMGGLSFWAGETERRIEATYPNIDVVVSTAANADEQANNLQDLVTINQIDALVVLPFESDPYSTCCPDQRAGYLRDSCRQRPH